MSTATHTAASSASHVHGVYAGAITDAHAQHFADRGYLVFPGWIPENDIVRLKSEIDIWSAGGADDRYGPVSDRTARQIDFPGHWDLMTKPELMAVVERLLGPGFGHHHIHTAKHVPGDKGVTWHHDYEQHPQTNRSHGMLHTFWYLNGLDGTIGDLLVLPGSQRMIIERGSLGSFGTEDLPGSLALDNVPAGTMVVVHSAVLHARRPKAGGDPEKPRYFIDSSYCQAGIRWPHNGAWLRSHARAMADGRAAAIGREHLFDPGHFYDVEKTDWPSFHQANQGSLMPKLLGK